MIFIAYWYKSQKKQLVADKRRITEHDKLIQQIYEDKIAGTLTEKMICGLSKQYGNEQETLEIRIAEALGVISFQRDRIWYWDLPIVVEYEECKPEGQDISGGQARNTGMSP